MNVRFINWGRHQVGTRRFRSGQPGQRPIHRLAGWRCRECVAASGTLAGALPSVQSCLACNRAYRAFAGASRMAGDRDSSFRNQNPFPCSPQGSQCRRLLPRRSAAQPSRTGRLTPLIAGGCRPRLLVPRLSVMIPHARALAPAGAKHPRRNANVHTCDGCMDPAALRGTAACRRLARRGAATGGLPANG